MSEIWKPIPRYEGIYDVSSLGNIRRLWKGGSVQKLMQPVITTHGYFVTTLHAKKKKRQILIHRAVLEAFVGEQPSGCQACHGNNIRRDNRLENLRWDTVKANHADRLASGTVPRGEAHRLAKLTNESVLAIRKSSLSQRTLGLIYGVSQALISLVKKRKIWRHI